MQNTQSLSKLYIFLILVIFIPFLEFYYANIQNIDSEIFFQLTIFFVLTLLSFSLVYFLILKININNEAVFNYMVFISFTYWLLFRFGSIKDFFGGDDFSLISEIAFFIMLFLFALSLVFIRSNNFFKNTLLFYLYL